MVILRFYKQMKNPGLGNGERGEKTWFLKDYTW